MSAPPPPSSSEPPDPTGSPEPVVSSGDASRDADPQCREAVAELYAFLDGELDETTMIEVEEHLRRCSPCLEAFDFEAELRRVIVARCSEEVPPELRERFCALLRSMADSSGVPAGPDGS